MASLLTSASPLSLILSAMRVKSPFSQSALFGFIGAFPLFLLASPTGTHDVIVFERDCGATTEWSTQVSIVRGGSAFLEKPTALRSTQPGNALVILARAKRRGVTGIAVIAKWTDDTHVTLEYEAGAGMSTVATVVDGITITPQSVERSQ